MNCFHHPEKPAVALCKSCLRGLCADCAVDIHDGLACKGTCEERVRKINQMVDGNSRVLATTNLQLKRSMIFSVAVGLLFIVLGFQMLPGNTGVIFIALGVAFCIRGISSYTRKARYPAPEEKA